MPISQSALYGLIQGLTEFLPVSSSAHLTLAPFFFGWVDPGLAFDVALHWGTLLALLAYFHDEVTNMTRLALQSLAGARSPAHELPWKIAVATVPGAILGFLFEKQAETIFRSPMLIAGTLSIMGAGLWAADRWGAKNTRLENVAWSKALIIGLGQGLAIIPGVSRSGITITTGLMLGLDRESAVVFSFFMAIPITFGAGLLKAKYLVANVADPSVLAALAISALSGIGAIHILITYVRKRSFTPFVIYRVLLAAVIIAVILMR